MTPFRLGLVLVATLALAAVPGGPAAPGGGLQGVVLRGPTQPVCLASEGCEAPASVTLVFSAGARETARVRTSLDGRFRIMLPPGRYGVRTLGPAFQRVPDPAAVDVPRGRFARVVFRIDSGIR